MSDKIVREQDTKDRIELLSKRLLLSNSSGKDNSTSRDNIALGVLRSHLENSKTSIVAAKVILESNPSLERSLDILAGLIANPDGASGTNFLISSVVPETPGMKIKQADINEVIDFISDYVNNTVKMRGKLEGIVKEILGVRGAHVELYIPDGVTQEMFNKLGTESSSKVDFEALSGKVKNEAKNSLDKFIHGKSATSKNNIDGIDISSEWETYLPKLITREKFTKIGNEADRGRAISLSKIMRTRRFIKDVPTLNISKSSVNNSRLSTMVKDVPAEAVHPVCMSGDPENVLGYLFLLDENDGFVRIDDYIDFDATLRNSSNNEVGTSALGRIANNLNLGATSTGKYEYSQARELYSKFTEKVENDMVKALMEDNYVSNYKLSDDQQLSEIMFWRLLKAQKTRILFVPDSLVSYIAFYRNAAGVGQSILTRAKLLSRLYTVLYYADYISYLDEAIPRTEVTITMDEADTDQAKTKEMVLAERALSKVSLLSVSSGDPAGAVDALSRHSTTVKVIGAGEASNTPQMDITEERIKRDNIKVDSEYVANIKRDLTQKLNIPQQWVDDSWNANFKAEVVRDNELVRKQLAWYTNILNEGTTDRVIKRILNDRVLTEACLDLMSGKDEATKKTTLEAILINLKVELPEVKTNGVDMNKDQLDTARAIITDVVNDQFPDELVNQIEEMDTVKLEAMRSAVRTWLLRRFTKRSTMFGEMTEILEDPKQLEEIAKIEGERMADIIRVTAMYTKAVVTQDKKTAKDLSDSAEDVDSKLAEEDVVEEEVVTDPEVTDDGTEDVSDIPEDDNTDAGDLDIPEA